MRRYRAIGIVAVVLASPAAAQPSTVAASVASLGAAARGAVELIVDSARVAGIPVEPLTAKVAEGKLKDATDAEIVAAVQALARRLVDARAALGGKGSPALLGAGAQALQAGVPATALERLARVSAGAGGRDPDADLAVALTTACDLLRQRVPVVAAVTAVESLLLRRAPDDAYARLRLGVEADVVAGASPERATLSRTAAIARTLPAPPPGPRGGTPPTPDSPR